MNKSLQDRVDYALNQLLEHIIPDYPEDDQASADDRFDAAFDFARNKLGSAGDPSVATDVHHAADIIKRRLVRDNATPEKALRFSHLYSRLLSQGVLSQKWGILYFLHLLSGSRHDHALAEVKPSVSNRMPPSLQAYLSPKNEQSPPGKHNTDRRHELNDYALKEAFAGQGLRRLAPALPPDAPPAEVPIPMVHRDRPRNERPRKADSGRRGMTDSDNAHLDARSQPSEAALLRDLPFTLQGLSSTNLIFQARKSLQLPKTIPAPLISLLHTIAEPCLLYRELQCYIDESTGGLITQSFRAALAQELRSYLSLVATLEAHIRRALSTLNGAPSHKEIGGTGVTLRRCIIWTRDATMGLRLMDIMVEQAKDKKGGQLISVIHSFALSYGDPFITTFAERLLSYITKPFYDMLRQWIYDGELSDPFLEFFVEENNDKTDEQDGKKVIASSVWEEKYRLNSSMVPSIITETLANKVFLIGKSLNFIRHGCNDAAWVEKHCKSTSKELRYGDVASLESSIDEAYKTTMARLISLMNTRFHLSDHLHALKKYLLLGSGDFIAVLMESLSSVLDRPANTQYRHTLTAQLEHAVRNSNAQFDPQDVLRRLDSRMLELSHGEIGWDVFTLEYKISPPVDVIVTPLASKHYLKVFNFLWRVKRVEFALGSTWRRCMTGARSFLSVVGDVVDRDWKTARCAVAEMVHFINQLQYYILFEVIESSWAQLQADMQKPNSTLDDLIQAHATYLNSITRKGLLSGSSASGGSSAFTIQLHELLKTMLAYKDAVDGLYSYSIAEFTRRQGTNTRIESRTAAGQWGITERDSQNSDLLDPSTPADRLHSPLLPTPGLTGGQGMRAEVDVLEALRQRLAALGGDFKARVNVLLGDLMSQPDADMRWLAMVMNFNDVYQPIRRKKRGPTASMDRSVRKGEAEKEKEKAILDRQDKGKGK